MKVRAFAMDGNLARTAQSSKQPEELEHYNDILCEGNVTVTKAYIEHGTQKEHCRPYLVLDGIVTSIEGDFPQNVTEVHFDDPHRNVKVSYQYQFSNKELSDMCEKGLFDDGFDVPEIFTKNNGFQLPMNCDCFTVKNTEIPILFVSVQSQFNLEIDAETSGYVLGDYFEKPVVKESEFVDDEMVPIELDEEKSLFESPTEKTEEQEEVLPQVKELSEEEKILNTAFANIETRVERKVFQLRLDPVDESNKDIPEIDTSEPEAVKDTADTVEEYTKEESIDEQGAISESEPASESESESNEFVDEDFVEEDEIAGETEDVVSESEKESEDEKKKSSAMQTAANDIKEAVIEEKKREVPQSLEEIAEESEAVFDESEFV